MSDETTDGTIAAPTDEVRLTGLPAESVALTMNAGAE